MINYSFYVADYLVKRPVILELNTTYRLLKHVSILNNPYWFLPSLHCLFKATGVILVDRQG